MASSYPKSHYFFIPDWNSASSLIRISLALRNQYYVVLTYGARAISDTSSPAVVRGQLRLWRYWEIWRFRGCFLSYPAENGPGSPQWKELLKRTCGQTRTKLALLWVTSWEYLALNILEEIFLRPISNGLGFLLDNRKLPNPLFKPSSLKYHESAGVFNTKNSKDLKFVNICRPIYMEEKF